MSDLVERRPIPHIATVSELADWMYEAAARIEALEREAAELRDTLRQGDSLIASYREENAELRALLSDLRCVIFVEHGLRPGYGWDDYVARIDAALGGKANGKN